MCYAQGSTLFKPNGSLERILRVHLVSTSNMCSVVGCVMTLNLKISFNPAFSWNLSTVCIFILGPLELTIPCEVFLLSWSRLLLSGINFSLLYR